MHTQYPFTLLLFTSVDFSINTDESIYHMRGVFEEKAREALERASTNKRIEQQTTSWISRVQLLLFRAPPSATILLHCLGEPWS